MIRINAIFITILSYDNSLIFVKAYFFRGHGCMEHFETKLMRSALYRQLQISCEMNKYFTNRAGLDIMVVWRGL